MSVLGRFWRIPDSGGLVSSLLAYRLYGHLETRKQKQLEKFSISILQEVSNAMSNLKMFLRQFVEIWFKQETSAFLPSVKSDPRFLWFWFAALCDWLEKGRAILLTNDKSLAYQNQWHLCHTRFCTLAQLFTMRYLSTCKLNFREYKWELSRVFSRCFLHRCFKSCWCWLHEGQSRTTY